MKPVDPRRFAVDLSRAGHSDDAHRAGRLAIAEAEPKRGDDSWDDYLDRVKAWGESLLSEAKPILLQQLGLPHV
jgi:hypothetical protein